MTSRLRFRLPRPGERFLAALFFLALTLVVLWDVVVGGGVLASTDSLYANAPFAGVAPAGWKDGSNLLLQDSPRYFQPMLELTRDRLREGSLPLWNPLIGSGVPLLANQQAAPFSVVNLPVWILPFEAGLAVSAGLKLWLAGFGTHLLARRLGLGLWPSLAAGTAFALGSYSILWLSHGHMNVMALLPWALVAADRLAERPTLGRALATAIALALILLGGHPESEMFAVLAVWIYFSVRIVADRRRGRDMGRRLAALAGASALALLLAAVMILPFLAELRGSVDSALRGGDTTTARESLLTLLFPDWWGRPTEGSDLGPRNYNERTFYAGVILLILVPVALLQRGQRRLVPVIALGLFGLAASTDATRVSEVFAYAPFIDQTTRGRLSVFIILAVALLGAAGLDAIARRNASGTALLAVVCGALAIGVLALVLVAPEGSRVWSDGLREAIGLPGFSQDRPLFDPPDGATRQAFDSLRVAAVVRFLALVGAVGLVILAAKRSWLPTRFVGPALVALVVLDLATFARGYQPVVPAAEFYRPVPGSVRTLQQHLGSQRFAASGETFPADVNMYFGLRDIRSLDHPTPERALTFWRASLNPGQVPIDSFRLGPLTRRAAHELSTMSVSYLMLAPREPAPRGRAFERVYSGRDAQLWRNRAALPRAYAAGRVQAATSPPDALRRVTDPAFDARRSVVIEPPPGQRPATQAPGRAANVAIARDEPERVDLKADLERPGLVVLTDSFSRGWEVTIDGRPAQPLRANYLYRAVAVPAGRHAVSWRYRPAAVTLGVALTLLGVLIVAILGGVSALRRVSRR